MKHGLIIYFLLLKEETKDIDLFAPITEREECPICMLVLPLTGVTFFPCCGKRICDGCTNKVTDAEKNGKPLHELKCAFCQQLMIHIHDPKSEIKATPIGLFARYKAVRKKGDVRFALQRLHGKITKLELCEFFIILLQSTKLDTFKKYYFSHTANFSNYL